MVIFCNNFKRVTMEEREEGEISDCELSDISSEEEYLLRQRLHVLETYNHALERKSERRKLSESSQNHRDTEKNALPESLLPDLSDISGSDLENCISLKIPKKKHKTRKKRCSHKTDKTSLRRKTSNVEHKYEKLTVETHECNKNEYKKYVSSSSDETDEYRNKRRKLQHSVEINTHKADLTSLKIRLLNMFDHKICAKTDATLNSAETEKLNLLPVVAPNANQDVKPLCIQESVTMTDASSNLNSIDDIDSIQHQDSPPITTILHECNDVPKLEVEHKDSTELIKKIDKTYEVENHIHEYDKKDEIKNMELSKHCDLLDSDDDIEMLRQNALQTKTNRKIPHEVTQISESDDSEELRIICLKSKVLKNRLEYKRKIRLQKKLQQMSSIDDLEMKLKELSDEEATMRRIHCNTDNESVDMEIGASDGSAGGDDAFHENINDFQSKECFNAVSPGNDKQLKIYENDMEVSENDVLEEDEDLLRAKLLTSLSNNLQKLYKTENQTNLEPKRTDKCMQKKPTEPKRFVITLGGSDSETEDETKNTTEIGDAKKTADFESKLDILLRSARRQAELKEISKVLSTANYTTSPEKFVPKKVSHLPKSEQLEYKRLVKRMTELEKLKQNRQIQVGATQGVMAVGTSANFEQKKDSGLTHIRDKAISSASTDLESQIAISRKRIALESAKVLRLKEESTKLVQKYKMAQAELRNVRTAMALNKRQTLSLRASLADMTAQHQMLIKRTRAPNGAANTNYAKVTIKTVDKPKMPPNKNTRQINNKSKLQSVTVSVVNDLLQQRNAVTNTPNTVTKTPNAVTKTPNAVTKTPNAVTKTPNAVTKTPNAVTKTPNASVDKNLTVSLNVSSDQKFFNVSKSSIVKTAAKENHIAKPQTHESEKPAQGVQRYIDVSHTHSDGSRSSNMVETRKLETCSIPGDYISPLASMMSDVKWLDPHGILCPFEFQGCCRDVACTYQHAATRP